MRNRCLTAAAAVLAAFALITTHAEAQPAWNDKTILTFNTPVRVPGSTLPAGTYMFKLADLQGNRNVVQIFDEHGQDLKTTVIAVPTRRSEPEGDVVVMFANTPAGMAPALKGWFRPGDRAGHEFVYSREEARRISDETREVVLSGEIEREDAPDLEYGTLVLTTPASRR